VCALQDTVCLSADTTIPSVVLCALGCCLCCRPVSTAGHVLLHPLWRVSGQLRAPQNEQAPNNSSSSRHSFCTLPGWGAAGSRTADGPSMEQHALAVTAAAAAADRVAMPPPAPRLKVKRGRAGLLVSSDTWCSLWNTHACLQPAHEPDVLASPCRAPATPHPRAHRRSASKCWRRTCTQRPSRR
jgi:hypothetical protein